MGKELKLSGIVDHEMFCEWPSIVLIQDDKYRIDLIARLIEAQNCYGYSATLKIWDESEKIFDMSGRLYVCFEYEYCENSEFYDVLTDTILKIDKVDVYRILSNKCNKYITVEVCFK